MNVEFTFYIACVYSFKLTIILCHHVHTCSLQVLWYARLNDQRYYMAGGSPNEEPSAM